MQQTTQYSVDTAAAAIAIAAAAASAATRAAAGIRFHTGDGRIINYLNV